MKDILIIEPTGAICINPNLSAIVRLLCDHSYHVDIISLKDNFQQEWNYENSTLILCSKGEFKENISSYNQLKTKYDLIIGVDQSIIPASAIAKKMNVPFGFISYEILFKDEVDISYKVTELNACKGVSFAISQDPLRAQIVSSEYNIPLEKIICMPVSDEYSYDIANTDFLRSHFNIPKDKKIALFTGAVTQRSMIDDLMMETNNWDPNWVLVIHSYSGIPKSLRKKYEKKIDMSKIFFSNLKVNKMEDLLTIIASADVGIGFFTPNFSSKYECKNILFMGLSSGKFAMYLKARIPVIINDVGLMSNLVRDNNLGIVVNEKSEMNPKFMDSIDTYEIKERCKKTYLKYFDFNNFSESFLSIVNECIANKEPKMSFNKIDFQSQNDNQAYINRLSYWFNLSRQSIQSKYYVAGYNLFNAISLFNWAFKMSKVRLKKALNYKQKHFVIQFNDNLLKFFNI